MSSSTEIENLKKKLAVFEKVKQSSSESEANYRRIFDMFDEDKSGDLNAKEFSQLLNSFGGLVKEEEIKSVFRDVDVNNSDKIEWSEFLGWLQAQSYGKEEFSTLNLFRQKLQSPTYQSLILGAGKKMTKDSSVQKYQVNVGVGDFNKAETVVNLRTEFDEASATAFRQSLGGEKNSVTVAVTLSKKEDQSDFEFGEFAGLIRIALISLQAQNDKKFTNFKITKNANGDLVIALNFEKKHRSPIYSITETNWKTISEFVNTLKVDNLEAKLEISQSPTVQRPSEMLAARLHVEGQATHSNLANLANFFVEKAENGKDNGLAIFVKTLELGKGVDLNVSFDSFQAFVEKLVRDFKVPIYRELKMDANKTMPYNGFGLVAHILKTALSALFKSATRSTDEPEKAIVLRAIYEKALTTLKGITSLQVSLDSVVSHFTADNLDAVALLPSAKVAFDDAPDDAKPEPELSLDNNDVLIEQTFTYTANETGAVRWLQLKGKAPPKVTASSVAKGKIEDFISRENVMVWTANSPNSWFMVDFGENCGVKPNYYSVKYSSGGDACCPRNWELQGATEINEMGADFTEWKSLSVHTDDTSISSAYQVASFPIKNATEFFRFFRIIQTGPNAFKKGSNWVNVLVMGGFEIYGNYTNQVIPTSFDD